jgi:hypothetical protein
MKLSKLTLRTKCECADPHCSTNAGRSGSCAAKGGCSNAPVEELFRVDYEDETGTALCLACAQDAWDSGLFSDEPQRLVSYGEED